MRTDKLGQRINIDNRGKIGRGGGFGFIRYGKNFFGLNCPLFGVWQKKYYYGKPYLCRQVMKGSTNHRYLAQQNWRYTHAFAVYLWQNMETEQKEVYRILGIPFALPAYQMWLKKFLREKPHKFGHVYFGYGF